ncbi:hypothetical protein [uncultured Massilia sp.]|uniref:hypothetical protein n=1 Tax=uncultured Massilia sp. TaxID=169973 RepID=UPI002590E234|nr:hypothetical protein [uncultured Massilia sp.]
MQDRFWRQLLRGTLPLLVWAGHFTFCYLLAAAQCTPALVRAGGPDLLPMGIATVLALALCAWLLWRERGILRNAKDAALVDWSASLGAVLAFVGIVWTGLPLLLVQGCA